MSKAKINDQAFAERLQWILKEKFSSNTSEFSRAVGIAITSLNRWLIGEADPSRSNLIKTAKASGVQLEWLATGQGKRDETDNEDPISRALNIAKETLKDSISMINSYESINVSAGFGSFNEGTTEPDGEEPYSDGLLARLGVKAHHCAVFWANGNSMSPTIENGDQMLVDLSKKEIQGNKIYLVQNGESVWVKRVKMEWDGVELISDNKEEYRPIRISADEAQNLQIIGQVVHIGHSLI
ncbi:XRE family transcriptional regulator [Actinobacillus pleuropneumoniae]|uniref:XRE family transcriptional regulator n=1 Tax=Actinobacillus pleuropneumoniae TaxID=715 RepID=UPI00223E4CBC|nr:helix-turn-helix transcriptional regulator [Actinobacillus pleuropneumoniae]